MQLIDKYRKKIMIDDYPLKEDEEHEYEKYEKYEEYEEYEEYDELYETINACRYFIKDISIKENKKIGKYLYLLAVFDK